MRQKNEAEGCGEARCVAMQWSDVRRSDVQRSDVRRSDVRRSDVRRSDVRQTGTNRFRYLQQQRDEAEP